MLKLLRYPKLLDLAALAAVALFTIGFICFRLDLRSLDLPPVYHGDTPWMFLSMKNILRFGWPTNNPMLGFPFGNDAALEPIYPLDTVLLAKLLAFATPDPIAASNLFVYLGHAFNAAIIFACFRILGLGRAISFVGAVSVAFLEFGVNPGRVYGHQPMALFSPLAVAGTLSLLPFRYARPWPRRLVVAGCLGAFIIGLSHPYYIAFSAMVISTSAALLLAGKRISDALFSIAMLLIIALVTAAAWFGPVVLADNVVPYSAPDRSWDSQTVLGLRVPDLIIPPRSALPWLQAVRDGYYSVRTSTFFDMYLGLTGLFGAVVATLFAVRVPVLRRPSTHESETAWAASVLAAFCLAFGITNGLGLLFAMTITSVLRAQDRIVPLLAFYCCYIGLLSVETWSRTLRSARARAALAGLAIAALLIGLLDQTHGLSYSELQTARSPLYRNDRRFYAELERALPAKTAVLQLPPMYFPEDATYMPLGLGAYDELRGATYTKDLRWSFGLSSDNQGYLSQLGKDAAQTIAQAIARGFGAVLIHKDGYADRGAAVSEQIARLLDRKPLLETSLYIAFQLPSVPVERQDHGEIVAFWRGLGPSEHVNGSRSRRDNSPDGTVTIFVANQKGHTANLRFSGFLVPALEGEFPATFSVDNASETFIAPRSGIDLSREIALAPGRHRISIHVEVPAYKQPLSATPGLHFRIIDPGLTDVSEIDTVAAAARTFLVTP
jgi:hypothetical protein